MSVRSNVYGNVYDYTTEASVYGDVFEWVPIVAVGCTLAAQVYRPGLSASGIYLPGGAVASYVPGASEIQAGCC